MEEGTGVLSVGLQGGPTVSTELLKNTPSPPPSLKTSCDVYLVVTTAISSLADGLKLGPWKSLTDQAEARVCRGLWLTRLRLGSVGVSG